MKPSVSVTLQPAEEIQNHQIVQVMTADVAAAGLEPDTDVLVQVTYPSQVITYACHSAPDGTLLLSFPVADPAGFEVQVAASVQGSGTPAPALAPPAAITDEEVVDLQTQVAEQVAADIAAAKQATDPAG